MVTTNPGMIIVTAADETYWRCLYQYLLSIERYNLTGVYSHIAYNLGIAHDHCEDLQRRFPWCSFRSFDASAYPPHVAVGANTYAWKPVIIDDTLLEADAIVLWMDSANVVTSDLREVERVAHQHGTFTLKGQAPLRDRCDAGVLKQLGVPPEIQGFPERVSTACAFDAGNDIVVQLVRRWRELSMDQSLLRPENPSTDRHMPQSILGSLLLMAAYEDRLVLNDTDVDISSGHPTQLFTTRNKVSSGLPLWADPIARGYYWTYKKVDQAANRLECRLIHLREHLHEGAGS